MEQQSPHATTPEPVFQSPGAATTEALAPGVCSPQQEKPLQWEAHAPQLESSPRLRLATTREKLA